MMRSPTSIDLERQRPVSRLDGDHNRDQAVPARRAGRLVLWHGVRLAAPRAQASEFVPAVQIAAPGGLCARKQRASCPPAVTPVPGFSPRRATHAGHSLPDAGNAAVGRPGPHRPRLAFAFAGLGAVRTLCRSHVLTLPVHGFLRGFPCDSSCTVDAAASTRATTNSPHPHHPPPP